MSKKEQMEIQEEMCERDMENGDKMSKDTNKEHLDDVGEEEEEELLLSILLLALDLLYAIKTQNDPNNVNPCDLCNALPSTHNHTNFLPAGTKQCGTCKPINTALDNQTTANYFILQGLTDHEDLKIPLFMLFLLIYITTLLGNLGMILLIRYSSQVHTPMYFFLSNLSLVDLCYSSVSAPKLLDDILGNAKAISYSACVAQTFLFFWFLTTEVFLLAAMAYDRYTAICNPLLYTVVMSTKLCVQLVAWSYLWGLLNSLTHTCLLKLACSDTHINEILFLVLSKAISSFSTLIIIISYLYILFAILRIHSAEGRRKTFSTCASHLTAVIVFTGSLIFSYIQPTSNYSLEQEKVSAVFYSLVVPMLNPLIYSLRNREVKDNLRRMITRKKKIY
ncbi:olfactory receptor 1052-like [Alligator sinensis]|uniref:Olfactory receptor n=1 Tax=Alligator sinensis TaxID=38654 RepID=A0A3Q0FKC4_ALLSI|nr:olfactory receptor 1052-like [Alligator sinensis]